MNAILKQVQNVKMFHFWISLFLLLFVSDVFFNMGHRIDIIETFFMGTEFKISYPKHPFVTFWLAGLIGKFINQEYFTYLGLFVQYVCYIYLLFFTKKLGRIFACQEVITNTAILITFCIIIIKRIQFTPDLLFIIFSSHFLLGIYLLLQKQTHKNYILVVVFGLLLFFTKYQAVIIYACGLLPFLFTQNGRKIALQKPSIIYAIPMFFILASYIIYAFKNEFPSVVYASQYSRFQIKNLIGYIITLFLITYFLYKLRKNLANQNFLFVTFAGYGYAILTFVGCIFLQHGTSVRLFFGSLPFLCFFFSFLIYEYIKTFKEARKQKIFFTIIAISLFANFYRIMELNLNNFATTQKHIAHYLEGLTQNQYITLVQYNREFDNTYPFLGQKVKMRSLEILTPTQIVNELRGTNFLLVGMLNEFGQWPAYLYTFKQLLPEYEVITYPIFYEKVPQMNSIQRSSEILMQAILFKAPNN